MSQNSEVRRALSFEEEWQRVTGTDTMIPTPASAPPRASLTKTRSDRAVPGRLRESVQWVLDHPAEAAALAEEHLGMKAAVWRPRSPIWA